MLTTVWRRSSTTWALCLGGLFFVCFLGFGLITRFFTTTFVGNETDFFAFYAGARLAGTPNLYSQHAIWAAQTAATGHYSPGLLFIRLPCFALFLWPLAQLPYEAARYLWAALQCGLIAAAVWLWPGSRKIAAIVTCWSFPILTCLAFGTDTAMIFFWLACWRRLESKGYPIWAGLALALCIAKFHFFLLLPWLLIRHRRWLILQGLSLGLIILGLLSSLTAGWAWPLAYLHVLTSPAITNQSRLVMPNIHGFAQPGWEFPLVLLTLILTIWAVHKCTYTDGFIVVSLGSFLCSYHAYVHDGVILLPVLILILEKISYTAGVPLYNTSRRSRFVFEMAVCLAVLLVTPFPWVALMLRH